jgi:hypothetical protein
LKIDRENSIKAGAFEKISAGTTLALLKRGILAITVSFMYSHGNVSKNPK